MNSEETKVILGTLIHHKKGFAFKSKDYIENGIPVIRVSNFSGDTISPNDVKFVSNEIASTNEGVRLHAHDIVIATVGSWPNNPASVVGRTISVPLWANNALMNQNSVIIRAQSDSKIDQKFIYYQLKTEQFSHHLISKAQGSANQASITLDAIFSYEINWPDSELRRSTVAILEALDDRIALLRETNTTLEAIAQALFKSWFVDFDPVRAKQQGREPEGMDSETAALFPDSFEESKLGVVPRGWQTSTLDEISTVGIGKTPPRKEQHWFSENPNDVRWVSIRDMGISGAYISTTNEFLTAESIKCFNVRVVPDNTVMLSFKMTIGRVAISDGEMTTNEAIAHFKLDGEAPLSTEFIYLHLKQFDYSTLSSTSSIADAVNSKTVKSIPIIIPALEILVVFQDQISVIFQKIKIIEQQIKTLATLRDTLLPRLISGQLRLPEASPGLV